MLYNVADITRGMNAGVFENSFHLKPYTWEGIVYFPPRSFLFIARGNVIWRWQGRFAKNLHNEQLSNRGIFWT